MLFIQPDFQFEPLLLFDINLGSRILELHIQIVQHWCWLRYFSYHLEFNGHILEERQKLTQYGIKDQSKIYLRVLSPDAQAPPSKHQGSHIVLEKCNEVAYYEGTDVPITDLDIDTEYRVQHSTHKQGCDNHILILLS